MLGGGGNGGGGGGGGGGGALFPGFIFGQPAACDSPPASTGSTLVVPDPAAIWLAAAGTAAATHRLPGGPTLAGGPPLLMSLGWALPGPAPFPP